MALNQFEESTSNIKTTVTSTSTTIKTLYQHFCENTGLHGIRRTVTGSRWRRALWASLTLACSVLAVSQLATTYEIFSQFPVVTVVSLQSLPSLVFPAVTVCNRNTLKRSLVPDDVLEQAINTFIKSQQNKESHPIETNFLREIDPRIRKRAWHKMSDMLERCWFNQQPCSALNFTRVDGSAYGHCFTFNRKGNTEKRYISKAGPQYGLVLEMSVQRDEYIPLTSSAGIKIVIHEPGQPPFPEDGGLLVGPGQVASIGIRKLTAHRVPHPYGICTENTNDDDHSLYSLWNYTYTEIGCKKSCYQLWLYEICECCDFRLPCDVTALSRMAKKTTSILNKTTRFCDMNNQKEAICLNSVSIEFNNNDIKCAPRCPPACDESTFNTIISLASWPTQDFIQVFPANSSRFRKYNQSLESTEEIIKSIQENYVKLEVYYETLDLTMIDTSPVYDWSKLLGEIGGQMGICFGFSILTGLEIIELMLDTAHISLRSFYNKIRAQW